MERHIQEVLASQRKMLERAGQQAQAADDRLLAEKFETHIKKISVWIKQQPNMECLYMSYKGTIQDPSSKSLQVSDFLGKDLDVNAMAQAIDGSLYRNRHRDLKK